MNNLKIFEQDNSWCGNIVVVAENEEQARELMKNCPNYNVKDPVISHEIVNGLVICNTGDM